jgi:zinc ribbon protein
MADVWCSFCGAGIADSAKFCRACGRALDPSELTTRNLETDSRFQHPTAHVQQAITTPAYLAPSQVPAAPSTNDLAKKPQSLALIITLAALVGVLLFALALFVFLRFDSGTLTPDVSVVSIPNPPPGAPPPPPPPPVPGDTAISDSLAYPGAKTVMNINSARGKSVLQLQTTDSPSKVVAWYKDKLKPTQNVDLPFGNSILKNADTTVVITAVEDGTNILISRGED